MKLVWIRIGVLTGIFLIAVVVFAYFTNRGNTDLTADMGGATLPRISFQVEGYTVNELIGYVKEMEISAMRDTITPIPVSGEVTLNVMAFERKLEKMEYEVLSRDGETSLLSGSIKKVENTVTLPLGEELPVDEESMLKLTLHADKGNDIYYYIRVIKSDELFLKACMDFAGQFHEKTFDKRQMESLSAYLEPDAGQDNNTFQQVTIHSDIDHLTWGSLKPEILDSVRWSIKECNASYSSLLLEYQVSCLGDSGETETYNIKEFFRVRSQEGTTYLLDYSRTMDQVFVGNTKAITEKGVTLGIAPLDIPYLTNKDGTIVSFVQEREVWNYDQKNDALSLVFAFSSSEDKDIRNLCSQHKVKLIDMEENGNTTFAVYGYMNRGEHEGKVGAAVYYYDIAKNAVEEKVFIPSKKSYAIAESELGRLVYYHHETEVLYIMTDGTLYKVDLEENKKEVLVKDLKDGQYIASDNGHLLAYQEPGEQQNAASVKVLDFSAGKEFTIDAPEGESVNPLGFIRNDFVYGLSRTEDLGKTVSGQKTEPMYKVEICDDKGETVKTYALDQIYILDVLVEKNMITLNRATKNGTIYTGVAKDYITNNEEKAESNIMLTAFETELKEQQMRLVFSEGIQDKNAKLLKPKQVLFENPVTISFQETNTQEKYYVYGRGEMLGVYDKAGYAIQKASECSGVVVTGKQTYVWEKGNRDLTYEIENLGPVMITEGESTLAACLRHILSFEGKTVDAKEELAAGKSPADILSEHSGGMALDLAGCTTEQILYIIGKGTPVIAMTDSDNALLLTGYGKENVQYLNPAVGTVELQSIAVMEQLIAGSGNSFIGYVK